LVFVLACTRGANGAGNGDPEVEAAAMTDVSNVIVQLPAKQGELLEVIDPADVA
jgi:hypothetical protein